MTVRWSTPYPCPRCGQLIADKESEVEWFRVEGSPIDRNDVVGVAAMLNTAQTFNVGGELGEHRCPGRNR